VGERVREGEKGRMREAREGREKGREREWEIKIYIQVDG
jgi:hypothetical protein